MKKISLFIVLLTTLTVFSSCMKTTTEVGQYATMPGKEYRLDKDRRHWIFWGLLPINSPNVQTPADGNCKIVTKFTFGDFLITGLTAGIVTSYTIKSYAKKTN